jgi:P4 family phage/plasmid primase-like protien
LAFGEYTIKFPVTLITGKRAASGSANPELARGRGARFASLQEPDGGERINVGHMKELTGGDKIMARPLYKDPFEYKPQFKMVLCCNDLPKVPPDDEGTWRRLRVVAFTSKFTDSPDPENPNEFPMDPFLSEKLTLWKEAFMTILLQYYKKYKEHGLKEPDEVKAATAEYQKMSDVYAEFMSDAFVKDPKSVVKLEDSYHVFKTWYHDAFDSKSPVRKEFKVSIEKKLGKYQNGSKVGWFGYRLLDIFEKDKKNHLADSDSESETETDFLEDDKIEI